MDDLGGKNVREGREPIFNVAWPAIVVLAALALAFAVQKLAFDGGEPDTLVLTPAGVRAGNYLSLVSYIFLHSGWAHILMNGASALAFTPPVARAFGVRGWGALLFFIFFLLCGVLAGLGFCLVHWNSDVAVVGASGAISGLWGAASRLLVGQGRLAPIFDRQVLLQGAAFAVVNVAVGLAGGFSALQVAWEAHLFGYLAGLVLIGPFLFLARPRV